MTMRRCDADEHYYDNSKYSECPYCRKTSLRTKHEAPVSSGAKGRDPSTKTKTIDNSGGNKSKTVVIFGKSGSETQQATDKPPVAGWLVIVDGPGQGMDLRITPGMNRIGRDASMNLQIDFGDETISRSEHAFIIYDPRKNVFFLKHGSGQNLSYLNDDVVMEAKLLQPHDRIKMGETEFLFVPLCSDQFSWG